MVLRKIFPAMYAAPDTVPAVSRNATLYLLRCVFLMGIRWPPKNFFLIYCLWSLALNLCSTLYQPIGFMTGYIIHLSEYSPSQLLNSLQVALNAWTCSAKVIIVWFLVKRFDRANLILDEMDKRLTQPGEHNKVNNAVSNSNRIFFSFMTVYMIYATSSFISASIMGVPMFQNYYPFLDWRASRFQFWLQSGLEFFAMLGACFQDVCVDCYPINYVLPLRAHLANFAERLRQLGNDPDEHPDQLYEKLIGCILDHKVILRYCDTLRPVISGTIFVQLLVVGFTLGFTLINIVMFANFGSRIAALVFMTAVLMETTPFCILCNYLADDCYKVADALFESNWIHQEQRYKKTMLQFLQSLQKPIVFMAGDVFSISVATNLNATKFSFSVFTLVKQMNIAEKLSKPKEV
ncbi:odorant receptor 42a [Drosophila grimshawi]|uniref:Odorant receptor n=1 Tax=Drosophila grimshawi TaxID=7222 RepID=B4J9R5_DROGR|nr:odorant receptor 42a [Drosophila grimshawi]EDW01479.1 GH21457 [Drosophila grimshawi]